MVAMRLDEQAIFEVARKIDSREAREAYVQQVCCDDVAIGSRVRALLKAYDESASFLESPAVAPAATIDEPFRERPGTIIGPYKLLEQIGEGGFGLVFMAEQQQPVRRKVALKILKPGMDTRQVIARFEAERQALALMDHPNIARVLDAGATPPAYAGGSPRPFFVMELVRGVPITDYCDQNRLTTRERLALFVHVCQAVQHAHHKGIIHRDIKPSNVMVTLHDGVPVVKVIDFGIAKALGQQLTDKTLVTGFMQMVGTPLYMSPEQAGTSGLDVDTRSDIYSLGVLLYELLTGMTPFDKERLSKVGYDEMRRIIREEEPPRPSTRLSTLGQAAATVSAQRQSDPRRLSLLLRGELDWIVMKALDKDRTRRYETASAFAADVQRYLHDEPVAACPPSAWYRFRKFTHRHKTGLRIATAAALVLLLTVGGVSWTLWDQATRRIELSERMEETEQTVNVALIKAKQWGKQAGEASSATSQQADTVLALWRQAEAALAQAESALRTGTADDRLRQRVLDLQQQIEQQRAQAQGRANLLRNLDDARMSQSIWIETHFDNAGAATKYAAAFAAYGLEVKPGRTAELARRIRAEHPDIREALIVALYNWGESVGVTNEVDAKANKGEQAKLVRAIAAAADDDPWRQKYRAAATARGDGPADLRLFGDATALRALSREARQLALRPSSLEMLAKRLSALGKRDEALTLLRWARDRHLTDFWIHFQLGNVLQEDKDKSPVLLEEAIGCYRAALALRPAAGAVHNNLGTCLFHRKQLDEAILSFSKAIDLDPKHLFALTNRGRAYIDRKQWDKALADLTKVIKFYHNYAPAHFILGNLLHAKNQLDEAIAEYRQAIDLDPKLAPAHNNLGNVLYDKKLLDQAITEYRKAIKLNPAQMEAHIGLGNVLYDKKLLDQAITEYRKAIGLNPTFAGGYFGLGNVLYEKKLLDEAMAEYRKAIDLDHNNAIFHTNLGRVLGVKNETDKAMAEFRLAIKLDPKYAPAHNNLGWALLEKKLLDDAIAEYKKAIDLEPKNAMFHTNLGAALQANNRLDEAIAEYKKAIKLDDKFAPAHNNLGLALQAHKQLAEAIAEYKKAIALQPDDGQTYCNLADALRLQGQLSASLHFLKQGHALGSKRKDWRSPSAQWVADAERLVRLEAKLADVLARKGAPADNRERLGLLEVCKLQRRHVAAARLYADAFTADPKLADDLKAGHLYNAACFAALAAAGQGTDAGKLDDQEHSRLRKQALAWLRADLDLWRKRFEGGKVEDRQFARATLEHWQRDTDLTGVRDADALKKLSAEEREAWRKLWTDVAEVLKKAGNAKQWRSGDELNKTQRRGR